MPVEAANSPPTITTENPKPAAQPPEQQTHALEQILGDARAFEHHTHEDEQRHRQQHRVGHDPEDALRQRAENAEVHEAEYVSEHGEGERHAGQRQRHRIAGEQRRDDRGDHEHAEDFGEQHQRRPGLRRPRFPAAGKSTAAARIACAMPCSAIKAANSGITVLSTKTSGKPLVSCERSMIAQEREA